MSGSYVVVVWPFASKLCGNVSYLFPATPSQAHHPKVVGMPMAGGESYYWHLTWLCYFRLGVAESAIDRAHMQAEREGGRVPHGV